MKRYNPPLPDAFEMDREEFASICHQSSVDGPLVIDVMMNTLTLHQARRLSAWLVKAADAVAANNRKRKQTFDAYSENKGETKC